MPHVFISTVRGGVETIKPYVDDLLCFAQVYNECEFHVTEIGCGKAGFTPHDIAPLLFPAIDNDIPNIFLSEIFTWCMNNEKTQIDNTE